MDKKRAIIDFDGLVVSVKLSGNWTLGDERRVLRALNKERRKQQGILLSQIRIKAEEDAKRKKDKEAKSEESEV